MRAAFIIVEALATILETLCCILFLSGLLELSHKAKRKELTSAIIILSAVVLAINSVVLFSVYTILFAIVFVSVALKVLFQKNFFNTLVLAGFYYLYLSILDFLCISIMGIVVGDTQIAQKLLTGLSFYRCMFIICSKILLLLSVLAIRKLYKNVYFRSSKIFSYVVLGFLGILYLIELTIQSINISITINWLLFLNTLILMVYLLFSYSRYEQEMESMRIIRFSNELEQKKYEDLMEKYQEIRKLQHDFDNHILVLSNLIKDKKYDEAEAYLVRIGKAAGEISNLTWTGNTVVDFILNYKREEAAKRGIDFQINADQIMFVGIDKVDLCTIMANILDNAIESCQRVYQGEKWIQVAIRRVNDMVFIKVENAVGELPAKKGRYLKSSKKDKKFHGFGIQNIQAAVEKYNGEFRYHYDEKHFEVMITFFGSR